jgi:pilus assembly protein CpaE
LAQQLRPAIIIFDLGKPQDAGFAAIGRLIVASPHSAVFVTADDQRAETILKAVRAGAQEFLTRPVDSRELLTAVSRIACQRSLASAAVNGKVITLFGCKGGRGTTLIAVNLAMALSQSSGAPVVAVDLDLQSGDLSLLLNLTPMYTIHDVVSNLDRIDPLYLKSHLCEHPSGLSLLAAPQRIEDGDPIKPLLIGQLLSFLKASFAYVVVDTAPTYDDRTLAALDAADEILLIASPDFSSLYHTQRCLDLFDRLTYNPGKIKILLNRCPSPIERSAEMAQEVLKHQVFWKFAENTAVTASMIAGEPLVRSGKPSALAAPFIELADRLQNKSGPGAKPAQSSKGLFGLFRTKPSQTM